MSETPTAESDAPKGCPVTVWDGPYKHRCGLGATVGRCAYHGPFDPSLVHVLPPGDAEPHSDECRRFADGHWECPAPHVLPPAKPEEAPDARA